MQNAKASFLKSKFFAKGKSDVLVNEGDDYFGYIAYEELVVGFGEVAYSTWSAQILRMCQVCGLPYWQSSVPMCTENVG